MQKPVFYIVGLLFVCLACNKDKFNTKPSLTIKLIDPTVVGVGGSTTITFEFTDKEGDVSDSLFMKRTRINQVPKPVEPVDSFFFLVPDFPKKSQGEISLRLDYNSYLTAALDPQGIPDTLVFKFCLRDKAGNKSDTAISSPIVVMR